MHTPKNQNPEIKYFPVTVYVPATSYDDAARHLHITLSKVFLLESGVDTVSDLVKGVRQVIRDMNTIQLPKLDDRFRVPRIERIRARLNETNGTCPIPVLKNWVEKKHHYKNRK